MLGNLILRCAAGIKISGSAEGAVRRIENGNVFAKQKLSLRKPDDVLIICVLGKRGMKWAIGVKIFKEGQIYIGAIYVNVFLKIK